MANVQKRQSTNVSANKTVADNDSGLVQNVIADGLTLTLPAAAAGKTVTIRLGGVPAGGPVGSGANGSVGLTVTGSVTGLGAAGALTADKETMQVGDEITLVSGAATWYVQKAEGACWDVA